MAATGFRPKWRGTHDRLGKPSAMSGAVSKERTRNYLRQIKGSFVFKAGSMAASFLAVPLMINYLGQEQFGVWSTLLSVMSWIVFFDLGVGNGLRNKLAEALAKNDSVSGANFVASGYSLIGLIAFILWIFSTVASFLIPWQTVFNTQAIHEATLRHTVQIATFFIVLNFWVGLIGALLSAVQKTSMTALGQLISNMLALVLVFVLSKTTNASIIYLAGTYGASLVIANMSLTVWFYQRYPELRPKPCLQKQHLGPLLSVGMQFFTIQLAVLVIFTTDKMLITQLFGPQHVTQYEVVFKLFSVITFAHTIILAPLWSAYTDAYHKNDFVWIERMLRKQLLIFSGIAVAVIVMAVAVKPVIWLWIGDEFDVAWSLVISLSILALISTWVNIFAFFLNSVQKIKVSWVISMAAMLVNIPLSIAFAKYTSLGASSVVFGTVCALLPGVFFGPYQTIKIIRRRDVGIWSR